MTRLCCSPPRCSQAGGGAQHLLLPLRLRGRVRPAGCAGQGVDRGAHHRVLRRRAEPGCRTLAFMKSKSSIHYVTVHLPASGRCVCSCLGSNFLRSILPAGRRGQSFALASAAVSVRAAADPREAVPDLRRAAAGEVARAVVVEVEVHPVHTTIAATFGRMQPRPQR